MLLFPIYLFCALPIGLLIGAVILRTAVSFANRSIGPPPERPAAYSEDEDDWGDYPLPNEKKDRPAESIPKPSVGGGMLMVLAIAVVDVIVGAAIHLVVGEQVPPARGRVRGWRNDPEIISRIIVFAASFINMAGLLAAMLPTTFRRGCLAALYTYLICAGIAVIFLVPIFFLRIR